VNTRYVFTPFVPSEDWKCQLSAWWSKTSFATLKPVLHFIDTLLPTTPATSQMADTKTTMHGCKGGCKKARGQTVPNMLPFTPEYFPWNRNRTALRKTCHSCCRATSGTTATTKCRKRAAGTLVSFRKKKKKKVAVGVSQSTSLELSQTQRDEVSASVIKSSEYDEQGRLKKTSVEEKRTMSSSVERKMRITSTETRVFKMVISETKQVLDSTEPTSRREAKELRTEEKQLEAFLQSGEACLDLKMSTKEFLDRKVEEARENYGSWAQSFQRLNAARDNHSALCSARERRQLVAAMGTEQASEVVERLTDLESEVGGLTSDDQTVLQKAQDLSSGATLARVIAEIARRERHETETEAAISIVASAVVPAAPEHPTMGRTDPLVLRILADVRTMGEITSEMSQPAPVANSERDGLINLKKACLAEPHRTLELLRAFLESVKLPKIQCPIDPRILSAWFTRKLLVLLHRKQGHPAIKLASERITITSGRFKVKKNLYRLYTTRIRTRYQRASAPTTMHCTVEYPGGSCTNVCLPRLLVKRLAPGVVTDATADVLEMRQRLIDEDVLDPYGAGAEPKDFCIDEYLTPEEAKAYWKDVRLEKEEQARPQSKFGNDPGYAAFCAELSGRQ
jgi:hypothetical protein